jgi:hypothetical protein
VLTGGRRYDSSVQLLFRYSLVCFNETSLNSWKQRISDEQFIGKLKKEETHTNIENILFIQEKTIRRKEKTI